MSENDTKRLTEDDGSLAGDALLHAVRRDMLGLFKALDHKVEALDHKVEALDHKVEALDGRVEALDAKVEARLRDTTPMWEVVVSRLDSVIAEQGNHARRLGVIEGRLDVIEGEIRQLRRRNEAMIGQLSHDIIEVRAAQHDLEGQLEKLEKTPA